MLRSGKRPKIDGWTRSCARKLCIRKALPISAVRRSLDEGRMAVGGALKYPCGFAGKPICVASSDLQQRTSAHCESFTPVRHPEFCANRPVFMINLLCLELLHLPPHRGRIDDRINGEREYRCTKNNWRCRGPSDRERGPPATLLLSCSLRS